MKFTFVKRAVFAISKFFCKNSTKILAGLAVSGVIGTGYSSVKAYKKASDELSYKPAQDGMDAFRRCWKYYIPPVLIGTSTIACIIGNTYIGARKAAVLAGLLEVSNSVVDAVGEDALENLGVDSQKVRHAIAQHILDEDNDEPLDTVVPYSAIEQTYAPVFNDFSAKVLFKDPISKEVFYSTQAEVHEAMNCVNTKVIDQCYATLNDFYEFLGRESSSIGDDIGWDTDHMMRISYDPGIHNGVPCIVMNYRPNPIFV